MDKTFIAVKCCTLAESPHLPRPSGSRKRKRAPWRGGSPKPASGIETERLNQGDGMKKTLIALAVGSAFAAPAAFADVTLSGSINAGPAWVKSGDGSTGAVNAFSATGAVAQQGQTNTAINTNYSNVTIGSLEDLGGGLKLDFAYQL